ncbi:MAG: HEPN domain-containing protein [Candidatus Tectomicrobia bacterium]|nr:HEPN domain-containing protein [Candidatus Tectomicrobia bacterium]
MSEARHIYLVKARDSLAGAQSEAEQGRYNNSANRSYYACFQAAIAALQHADITPPGGGSDWSHAFVQAAFVGQLINRRKLYPARLRQALMRNMSLRHAADYESDHVSQTQAGQALQRSHEVVDAVAERMKSDEEPPRRS